MSAIEVIGLTKRYPTHLALDEVSFTVSTGECLALLGPSGCGKSTTLRLIAGLDSVSAGIIRIGSQDVTSLPPDRRHLSMVFQSYAIFPHLDVARNIAFGLDVRGISRSERNARLKKAAELVGLTHLLERSPSQLSGGQRQRVALARAIISERPVCLMDEPLSNLDSKLRHSMRVEIRELQQRLGMTLIYVTHDQVEAMTMADRVALMNAGKIEQIGTPEELYVRPASTFVAGFMGLPPMNFLPVTEQGARLGVRVEHLRLVPTADGRMTGTVTNIEYLGADTLVTLACGQDFIVARAGEVRPARGDIVGLAWHDEQAHWFDTDTGRRIVRAN